MRLKTFGCGVAMMFACLSAADATASDPETKVEPAPACATGSYRLADGSALDIGPGAPGQLRWRRQDGSTGALAPQDDRRWASTGGWTLQPDGHALSLRDCTRGSIRFDDVEGHRIALRETATRFEGSGVTLAGRLTMPEGEARIPVVVLVHGAEHESALERYSLQREFAAAGIGVFAYDKRGTGQSEGRYTQDYLTLAVDAIHAAREARRLAGVRAGRVGYQAGSQGGWVAPLAARIEPVDFVIVSFGLAVSPLDEDREAIAFDMQRAGHGAQITAKAMQIAEAVAAIVDSGFTEGYDELDALKARHGSEPWFASVRGNIAGYMLATPADTIRSEGPRLLAGVPARYDPMPVLASLQVPQLWILGGQDRDAPPFETLRRLSGLRGNGNPITTAVFPHADHGMYEFNIDAQGERVSTRQPEGYFRLMKDFIEGAALSPPYGSADLCPARP